MQTGKVERITKETSIQVELDLDNQYESEIDSGIGFFRSYVNSLC